MSEVDLVSEIARVRAAIEREAAATARALNDDASAAASRTQRPPDHRELSRQLAALHERVAQAASRGQGQLLLRAELATLLAFAETLRIDAEAWRAAFEEELERREASARQQREQAETKREGLVRRRDALQTRIHETAERLAHDHGGECRRTMPVFRLGEALAVCSITVRRPRRGLRPEKAWLVTLSRSRDDVVVRPR